MTIYRVFMALLVPALLVATLWRRLRGRAAAGEVAERLALAGGGDGLRRLWLHGASNGEITSARWLIEDLLRRDAGLHILVSCNNPTARAMVGAWQLPRVEAVLAPWDTRGAVRRFLRRWRPQALLVLENELWPRRIAGCAEAGVPVLAIAARLSAGSARNWARLAPRLLRHMLDGIAWLSAQDAGSERRFLAAGLPPDRLGPRVVLKSGVTASAPTALPFPAPPRVRCLLAASTHEGEDAAVLDAFLAARAVFDLLVIAPRHPQRGPAIAALARERGVEASLRSRGDAVAGPVHVADTLGEMALWYALCGTTFIGGTLVPKGGHTPFEPMAAGSAVLHGPSVDNFADIFATLDTRGAAVPVCEAADLARVLPTLTPERQAALTARAAELSQSADPQPILDAIARVTARPAQDQRRRR